ncbi:MAG: LPS-assembly protein LptD [Treponema sp.]|nr:LPS-assembly protein LptD [Treponema sp.]
MSGKIRGLSVKLALLLFALTAAFLYAQEEPLPDEPLPIEEESPEDAIPPLSPEQRRIDMDIKTSTLAELAAWCRSLGLSEGGTSVELAQRLRDYFELAEQALQGEDKRKIITIESARTTEYFTIEAVDEDYARLTGEVKISLKDGDAVHEISAWNILFNRSRNILTASGGVEYKKTDGDKIETFRGESITVNIDDWSSIFLGGVSERSLQSDSTTYRFAGTVISRNDEDVTILSKASIGSANEEALWSLNATRVWLLPGSDFAIFNAVLKVGEIPVMYIPFFYYPADEMIFHPVIGYRTREGNYVQTTTYILGRPKASSSSQSSLTKILGNSSDMEKKREGLFLRSTGKKAVDKDAVSLKAMIDHYANLGTYIGADLGTPATGILSPVNLSVGVGLTRTVVKDHESYTPFFPNYNGDTDWNYSNLFSNEVPFRYRLKTDSSIRGKYGSFSWNLPFYSDPLVESDFLQRSEEMDWINMIQKGAALDQEETAQNQLGSYSWQFSGNITPSFPQMTPYINSISISTISSTVSFRTVDNRRNYSTSDVKYYSPSSFFYSPDTATLYSMSGSVSGTPLTLGAAASGSTSGSASTSAAAADGDNEPYDPLKNIGVPRSPFEEKETVQTQRNKQTDKLVPPELTQRFDLPRIGNAQFSVDYRVAPTSAWTQKFDYNKWKNYDEIDWGDVSTRLMNIGGDASTTLNFNHSENLFSNSFSYTGNGTYRTYTYLNEEAQDFVYASGDNAGKTDPLKVSAAKEQEYRQSFFSTSYVLSSTLRPLYQNTIFKQSSLQYNLRGLAVKSEYVEMNDDVPEYKLIYGEWDKDKIESHQFITNVSAQIMDKTQTISLTAEMPPVDPALSWRTNFRAWITETDANMRILFPGEPDRRKLEPFYFTEKFNFGNFGSLSQNLVMDTEEKEITTLTTTLNLSQWGLVMAYTASRMEGYEYIPSESGGGWVQKTGDPSLQSRDFSLSFSKNTGKKEFWDNKLNFSINNSSRLFFDLQRYTSSTFTFSLGFTLGINKFIDLSMSANSENTAIYRYFKDTAPFNSAPIDLPEGPQNDLFLDLINSFRFDDEELRKISGFKMKNFNIVATHYLGDWNAVLNWSMSPYRPPGERRYEISNEVSFTVQWIPITEFKSDVSYNKRNDPAWKVQGLGN